jgi:ornithine cyclodeaminase/alanine dehydrogenase-like protein (mu-crystallin family)
LAPQQRLVSVAEWVLAVERAYVAAATGHASTAGDARNLARARAAAAAVASRFLAVGTPRSFGIVGGSDEDVELVLEAHRTWFAPRDIRRDARALACDIVCVYDATPIRAGDVRRGTHVNLMGSGAIDSELVATIVDEPHGLPALAAGLVDGRQLDEITIFVAGDVAIALAAF